MDSYPKLRPRGLRDAVSACLPVSLSPLSIRRIMFDAAVQLGARMNVLSGRDIHKSFRRGTGETVKALDGVSLEAKHGTLTALVGPDGAGKTTLIRLIAGLMKPDAGTVDVLGINATADPQSVQDRIGYMPQRFGLYEDLTVQENLSLYSDLHGLSRDERAERYPKLMSMTALGPFTARLAGRLSGGMKQKLGLACTLVRSPEMLLLDEPTVGVDPLSRRELWEIILQLVHEQGLTVLLSTSYLDEAERCGHAVVMHQGKVLAQGRPDEVSGVASGRTFRADPPAGQTARGLQSQILDDPGIVDAVPEGGRVRFVRTDAASNESVPALKGLSTSPVPAKFEDGFMFLLRRASPQQKVTGAMNLEHTLERRGGEVVVQVRDLVKRFGDFTAVDHVSFEVHEGEIFGLLGPNGAGKTTTFRMLCGLLPATEGELRVAGMDLRTARASARQRIGYVAQKFSLYGQLSVIENLDFSRERVRLARRAQARAHRLGDGAVRSGADETRGERPASRRIQTAPRHGRRAVARAGNIVSRRTDQRRRSAGAARILATDHRARRAGCHGDRDDAFHGGGRVLRPHGHSGRRPRPRSRHSRRSPPPRRAPTRRARADDGRRVHRSRRYVAKEHHHKAGGADAAKSMRRDPAFRPRSDGHGRSSIRRRDRSSAIRAASRSAW